ncbi:uncharacterized protein LOC143218132 [Lasioglossum baleicum]|uniref:uncharacterized protein LOC143218132 n=1 Tax=Lasioglossum baleicum TaxID=434251 RepID=UPI003FCE1828
MERNIQLRVVKRVGSKLAHYIRTCSNEDSRKRIKLVHVSKLENNIIKLEPAMTMDTDDTNAMERDTFEETYRPIPMPRTFTNTMSSRTPQTNTETYTQMPGTSTSTNMSSATVTNNDIQMTLNRQTSLMQAQFKKINARMDKLESMLTKLLKQQQAHDNPIKPPWLPFTTVAAMQEFEDAKDAYSELVNYLQYVGGYNLKEAVNLSFKETFDDNLLVCYSWRGMDEKLCLQDTEVIRAIQEAVMVNKHYDRPSKPEIETKMIAALRTAKERVRSRSRRQAAVYVKASNSDNFWAEDEGELEN